MLTRNDPTHPAHPDTLERPGDDVAAPGQDPPRILVVDEDPTVRMMVRLLLERAAFRVLQAESAGAAVDCARREQPQILLIDLDMPDMDVPVTIHRLRRDLSQATLPVLLLTADGGPDSAQRVRELGADDYIAKPFEPAVLVSKVRAVFQRLKARAA